jgi:hypothetical protein
MSTWKSKPFKANVAIIQGEARKPLFVLHWRTKNMGGGLRVTDAQQRSPCLSSSWMDCGVKRLVPDFISS